jgi:hypothetical protein
VVSGEQEVRNRWMAAGLFGLAAVLFLGSILYVALRR